MKCKVLATAIAVVLTLLVMTTAGLGDAYQKGSFVKSLNAVSTTGAGTSFALPMIGEAAPSLHTWTVIANGANPTAITVNLEGSIDGTHWFTLDTTAKADATWLANGSDFGEMRHVTYKPVIWLRCNLATFTPSAAETVTCGFVSTKY